MRSSCSFWTTFWTPTAGWKAPHGRTPAPRLWWCTTAREILIVNNPAGLAVDGPDDDTLLNRALLYLNQQGEYKENDIYTPALCHRLDTGTSGLVIIAKTPEDEGCSSPPSRAAR